MNKTKQKSHNLSWLRWMSPEWPNPFPSYHQGQLYGPRTHAFPEGPTLRRALGPAVTILKFLMICWKGPQIFIFALCPVNYVPVLGHQEWGYAICSCVMRNRLEEQVMVNSFILQVSWVPATLGTTTNFNMFLSHMGILLESTFWFSRNGKQPKMLHF